MGREVWLTTPESATVVGTLREKARTNAELTRVLADKESQNAKLLEELSYISGQKLGLKGRMIAVHELIRVSENEFTSSPVADDDGTQLPSDIYTVLGVDRANKLVILSKQEDGPMAVSIDSLGWETTQDISKSTTLQQLAETALSA